MRGPSRYRLPPTGAVAELMARDRETEGQPFGGWGGELATPVPEPQAPALPRPVIPPPPWSEHYVEPEEDRS
jgi:hypothetical protein